MTLTLANTITLVSSLLVAGGIWLIYTGSPVGGGPGFYADQALINELRRVGLRKRTQRCIGLALALSGCALQAASLFLLP